MLHALPTAFSIFLRNRICINWEDVLKQEIFLTFKRKYEDGILEVLYEVKERVKKKQIKHNCPTYSIDDITRNKAKSIKTQV